MAGKRLFCSSVSSDPNEKPCMTCWHCNAVEIEDHPDLVLVGLDLTKEEANLCTTGT